MRIFITGVSSGIGRALASNLVKDGHEVWGIARRKNLLEELQKELGEKIIVSEGDVSDLEKMKTIAVQMRKNDYAPDVVILNAGIKLKDVNEGLIFDNTEQSLRINVVGGLFWITEFLPDFFKRNKGLFIAISSTAAFRPTKDSVAYSATKAAMDMVFRGLRLNF